MEIFGAWNFRQGIRSSTTQLFGRGSKEVHDWNVIMGNFDDMGVAAHLNMNQKNENNKLNQTTYEQYHDALLHRLSILRSNTVLLTPVLSTY